MSLKASDYDKKTPREHVLARPDTYVGDIEVTKENHWIAKIKDSDKKELDFKLIKKEIKFVPGLLKIFDEIIVNASDHSKNDKTCNTIKVMFNMEEGYIEVYNNGNKGIPVSEHPKFKTLVPSMIFGEMLTSSNYDDSKKRTTGGRNGYGAKLTNIFSTKFTVEIGDPTNKKLFSQTWQENMSNKSEPKIKKYSNKNGYTKITFYPDLEKFGLKKLDKFHYNLFAKRCIDIAGVSPKNLKVYFNDKLINVSDFKKYMEAYYPKSTFYYDDKSKRWEVGVAFLPEEGDEYISCVNGISTYLGGTHVNHVVDQIVSKLRDDFIKKKNKDLRVTPSSIKQHLVFFINSTIENPAFSSQTKSTLTTKSSKFGSSYKINDTFIKKLSKSGIVEQVVEFAKLKAKVGLSKNDGKKQIRLRGIPKLEDANKAGSKDSSKCALFLTEGDSAKAFAMSGLAVTGRDFYGVFPLKGKLLNVREASTAKLQNNNEINNLVKIIGLKYSESYEDDTKFNQLRYGRIICLTDQDVDGSHIKGLLINMFHSLWPSLMKRDGFITSLSTPIVKAFKGKKEKIFYNLTEYEDWKESTNTNLWKIKYYKGLGTSTSKEAKDYFYDIDDKLIHYFFKCSEENIQPKIKKLEEDDNAITLAFEKSRADDRKKWLQQYDRNEILTYDERKVRYSDFINKELIHFSNDDLSRSIPSLLDGFKPSQRKIFYGSLKRGLDKSEVKVAQLSGFVSDQAEYHHGEASLQQAIIGMAQDYVGSNNINILKPNGQFGTRLLGGKDAASPRYIWTALEDLTTIIFNKHDSPVLKKQYEDGVEIEPVNYAPIIPMILVNGATGIGTGYSTYIPCYNPLDIIDNIEKLIDNEKIKFIKPWWNGFNGNIKKINKNSFEVYGNYEIDGDKLIITELPVGTWTTKFKESIEKKLEKELNKKKKNTVLFTSYTDNNTDKKVNFTINFKKGMLKENNIKENFGLINKISTTNMHLYSSGGQIKKYNNVNEILNEFYVYRLEIYKKRREYQLDILKKQFDRLSYKVKFILMKLDKKIKIENKKKVDLIAKLKNLKFPEIDESYDYLLGMPLWNLTFEKVEELKKQMNSKDAEYKSLEKETAESIWKKELKVLREKYIGWIELKKQNDSIQKPKKKSKSKKLKA